MMLAGVLLFAGFIHYSWPMRVMALTGLLIAAAAIAWAIRNGALLDAFGLRITNRGRLYWLLPAMAVGSAAGILVRNRFDLPLLPEYLTRLALVTPLIGAAEELIFRGFLQGYLRPIGRFFSIIYATAAHSCYKILVILSLSAPLQFDFLFLIFWTFAGGLVFGVLRDMSKNALPPVLAHALFDLLLYGGMDISPAWVWS